MQKKRYLVFVVGIILLMICLVSGYQILREKQNDLNAKNEYQMLAGMKTQNLATENVIETFVSPLQLQIDYEELKKKNIDFVAWIYYPGAEINYPMVQGTDNHFYLNHTFLKNNNSCGCIFLDCVASKDFSDQNSFVFGHNRKDGSMFGSLKDLIKNKELVGKYPEIYILYEKKWYTYKIFSYYETQNGSDRYDMIESEEAYDTYVDWAIEHSEMKEPVPDIDWTKRPKLLTLSTCYGNAGTTKRILVHCALQEVELAY